MDAILETTYGTTLSVNEWRGDTALGIDSVAAADPEAVEDYLDGWTPGDKVRRDVKLRALLDRIEVYEANIRRLNGQLADGRISLSEWEAQMGRQVKQMHLNAYVVGRSGNWESLTAADVRALRGEVSQQLQFLRRWRNELAQPGRLDDVSPRQLDVRGGLYGAASTSSFERGYQAERGIAPGVLPAQPGDGTTECLTNCRCRWSIRVISRERGDFDANWQLGASEHCRTCRDRARSWLGLRIRGGRLQSDIEPIFYDR